MTKRIIITLADADVPEFVARNMNVFDKLTIQSVGEPEPEAPPSKRGSSHINKVDGLNIGPWIVQHMSPEAGQSPRWFERTALIDTVTGAGWHRTTVSRHIASMQQAKALLMRRDGADGPIQYRLPGEAAQ